MYEAFTSLMDHLSGLGELLGFLGVIWAILRARGVRVWSVFKSINDLPALSETIRATHEQFFTNHGSTLKDDVRGIRGDLAVHDQRFRVYQDADGAMTFYADGSGRLTWTSTGLETRLRLRADELEGYGLFGAFCDEERERIRREWLSCFADKRGFDCNVQIRIPREKSPDEYDLVWFRIVATPVGEDKYSGFSRLIDQL